MKHDYYAMLAFTFVLLYLQSINCSLSTVTRYKRATGNTAIGNTAQTSVDGTQITEDTQRQTSDRKPFFDKCELLTQYLEAFNKAITEKPDKRKGGLGKTFEMIFPHNDGSNEANNLFYAMLEVEFENESSIVNGKMEAIAAAQKISLGRNVMKLGLKKNYMSSDQATSIVETTLHVNWASVVGGYLENKQREYLSQLEKARADARVSLKYHQRVPTQGQTSRASQSPNPMEPPMTLEQHLNKVRARGQEQTSGASPLQKQLAAAGFSADDLNRNKQNIIKWRADEKALEDIIQLQSRLTEEGTKIESHMKFIHELLSEAQAFFDKLAASSEKKSLKPSRKLGIGKSDGAQYSQINNKYDGTFNRVAKLESLTSLTSLEAVFGPLWGGGPYE